MVEVLSNLEIMRENLERANAIRSELGRASYEDMHQEMKRLLDVPEGAEPTLYQYDLFNAWLYGSEQVGTPWNPAEHTFGTNTKSFRLLARMYQLQVWDISDLVGIMGRSPSGCITGRDRISFMAGTWAPHLKYYKPLIMAMGSGSNRMMEYQLTDYGREYYEKLTKGD